MLGFILFTCFCNLYYFEQIVSFSWVKFGNIWQTLVVGISIYCLCLAILQKNHRSSRIEMTCMTFSTFAECPLLQNTFLSNKFLWRKLSLHLHWMKKNSPRIYVYLNMNVYTLYVYTSHFIYYYIFAQINIGYDYSYIGISKLKPNSYTHAMHLYFTIKDKNRVSLSILEF